MSYSEMFIKFINSFEDVDMLVQWGQDFGHLDDPVVRERILYLRNFPLIPSQVTHTLIDN